MMVIYINGYGQTISYMVATITNYENATKVSPSRSLGYRGEGGAGRQARAFFRFLFKMNMQDMNFSSMTGWNIPKYFIYA
jgi:hypothetical protein